MSDVSELLDKYGVSFADARAFIFANLSSPQAIYDAAGSLGISFSMLAELVGNNVSEAQVKEYFSANGFDTTSSSPVANLRIWADLPAELNARSQSIGTVSAFADRSTENVESVLGSEAWGDSSVTYNFPTSAPASHLENADTSSGWRTLTTLEREAFSQVVANQNQFIDVDLVQVSDSSDADIQVVAINQTDAEAFAYFPGTGIGGDIFFNANGTKEDPSYYSTGGYGNYTMAHELGHAMGGEHTFGGEVVLSTEYDNTYYSVMSYTLTGGYKVEAQTSGVRYSTHTVGAYRGEQGIIDVAALQYAYGADMSTNTGDTVYVYDDSTRQFQTSSGYYKTIWDAGGVDTLDVSSAKYGSTVNLNDYTLSSISQRSTHEEAVDVAAKAGLTTFDSISFVEDFIVSLGEEAFLNHNNLGIAFGVVIENVVTGSGNDVIMDNEVNNLIYAGLGNDTIYLGAGGYDQVDGGEGVDTVVLNYSYADVGRSMDSDGYHIITDDFAATLVGVETVQYLDTSVSIA